jgi:hypothetical protein
MTAIPLACEQNEMSTYSISWSEPWLTEFSGVNPKKWLSIMIEESTVVSLGTLAFVVGKVHWSLPSCRHLGTCWKVTVAIWNVLRSDE